MCTLGNIRFHQNSIQDVPNILMYRYCTHTCKNTDIYVKKIYYYILWYNMYGTVHIWDTNISKTERKLSQLSNLKTIKVIISSSKMDLNNWTAIPVRRELGVCLKITSRKNKHHTPDKSQCTGGVVCAIYKGTQNPHGSPL